MIGFMYAATPAMADQVPAPCLPVQCPMLAQALGYLCMSVGTVVTLVNEYPPSADINA